ncbi:putative zinc finger CCHC domain-containing protein [Chlorella vulgaris]
MSTNYGFFEAPQPEAAKGGPRKPTRQAPGRGVLDGIKKDLQSAKASGEEYDPRGIGSSWNHSFLTKKPWHPSNFRNMAQVWEKEHDHYEAEKKREESKAEFEAEQAFLKTLSLLSPQEQEKYRQRQSVSFLYMKPPGYDAALERAERAEQAGQVVGPGGEAIAGGQQQQGGQQGAAGGAQQQQGQQQQGQQQQRGGRPQVGAGGHLQNVINGLKAVHQKEQGLELKHQTGVGRSPPRGGASLTAPNQQFVVGEMDSEEEEETLRLAAIPPAERRRQEKQAAKAARRRQKDAAAQQLEQAKAFLRAAGLALPSDDDSSSSGGDSGSESAGDATKRKRHRRNGSSRGGKEKRSKREKKQKKRRSQ